MTGWTADELEKIETADELEIASLRSDGTLGSRRTIWVVRVDDDLEARIDDAYRQKYRRYAKSIVESTLTSRARSAALKLVPQD
jgi:hypothetical protein